jgi:3-oxoacyl-[acyl-carrier-protein] synthase I
VALNRGKAFYNFFKFILCFFNSVLIFSVAPLITPVHISAYTATCALGHGKQALLDALRAQQSCLQPHTFGHERFSTWVGRVQGLDRPLPAPWGPWDCRNNRLAWAGLQADDFEAAVRRAASRFGPARVAVVMGTSTSSIGATEAAYRQLDERGQFAQALCLPQVHALHSLGGFVQAALGLQGPCATLSTACSSGAKAFCAAKRMLRLGLVDAAVVGGVDSLCGSVLFGFQALQLLSHQPCRPFDTQRSGLSLGEAAGFALLQREPDRLQLLGYGESSDAHHMSAPHPQGLGAALALSAALNSAGLTPNLIDYIHLHGTATHQNDAIEAQLVARFFEGAATRASSTKGLTGHALGAAGSLGAAFSLLALETGWMPGTQHCENLDSVCGPQIKLGPAQGLVQHALSHSFGFGGSNCVLVFGRNASNASVQ